jgi:hypothetical protein
MRLGLEAPYQVRFETLWHFVPQKLLAFVDLRHFDKSLTHLHQVYQTLVVAQKHPW